MAARHWAAAALVWLVFINLYAYLAFRHDKRRAESGGWRVPEATLLLLALLGGWFGAKRAQRRFRHKTRKEPFRTSLNLIPAAWILGMIALVALSRGDANLH